MSVLDRAQRGRHLNLWVTTPYGHRARVDRARLSRELRDDVQTHGQDPDHIRRSLEGNKCGPTQPVVIRTESKVGYLARDLCSPPCDSPT